MRRQPNIQVMGFDPSTFTLQHRIQHYKGVGFGGRARAGPTRRGSVASSGGHSAGTIGGGGGSGTKKEFNEERELSAPV
jgi:hypothetical protein